MLTMESNLSVKLIGIVGWKNSGKTTLAEALVRNFVARGVRVATIKHAHHDFDTDKPGTDSYRHRAAGANQVIVASDHRWAHIKEVAGESPPKLEELVARLTPVDLVIVEGFKREAHPKIQVMRSHDTHQAMPPEVSNIIAIATDVELSAASKDSNVSKDSNSINDSNDQPATKILDLNAIEEIADYICDYLQLEQSRGQS